jgi:hypothetical protein
MEYPLYNCGVGAEDGGQRHEDRDGFLKAHASYMRRPSPPGKPAQGLVTNLKLFLGNSPPARTYFSLETPTWRLVSFGEHPCTTRSITGQSPTAST